MYIQYGYVIISTMKAKIIYFEDYLPHTVSEVICVKCGHRWISVRPDRTLLKDIECANCGKGYVIETGQNIEQFKQ